MSTLTVRNVDENLKRELRRRAAERGVSMEQQIRDVLADSVKAPRHRDSILADLRKLGVKPKVPFDLKKVSDDMWEEGLR